MPIELLINNIGFTISIVICMSLGILVFVRRPTKAAAANRIFLLSTIWVCIWQASYVIGTNLHDPSLSRFFFMFNLSTLLLNVSMLHLGSILTKKFDTQKRLLYVLYIIAITLIIFYIIFPDTFLLPSLPKLYYPNFFVPGSLYFLQDTFFFMVSIYSLYFIVHTYLNSDFIIRNKVKYFMVAYLYAYVVAIFPEFLLYNINVDPILCSLTGLYVIPMAYAILKYEMVDLNILAKRSLGYALSIASVTLFILGVGYGNDTITSALPNMPTWILPLCSSILAVVIGIFVWNKTREGDLLKYEFVSVVTHKFRTPLTYIHWSLDALRNPESKTEERQQAVDAIANANAKLFQLTESLTSLSGSNDGQFLYVFAPESAKEMIDRVIEQIDTQIKAKKISFNMQIPDGLPTVSADKPKIQFVLQMILENAVRYSKDGGIIVIDAKVGKRDVVISITDSGIGISKEDLPRLFIKFFRAPNATRAHTEGLGIGLSLSRDIIHRHGGELWAESEGIDKGSTFYLRIPIAKVQK